MSDGGPFRELFVEVPLAILDAAIKEAESRPKPDEPTPAAKLGLLHPDTGIVLFRDYPDADWKLIEWRRDAMDDTIVVWVKLKCGHKGYFEVDEWKLANCAFSAKNVAAYLFSLIEKEPKRRCKCGTPQGLGPAGRPK